MIELLNAIKNNWKTEAANESNEKYFLCYDEVNTVLNGTNCFVIGRKGAGKTAICQYIENLKSYDEFSSKLDFKNFPFNLLYQYSDDKYSLQHKYITLWMQLIYMHVLKLFLLNKSIDSSFQDMLKKAFPYYMDQKLENQVRKIDSINLSASVKGVVGGTPISAGIGGGGSASTVVSSWVDNEDTLLQLIKTHSDDSKYYIVFDALDDDYSNIESDTFKYSYLPLLTSLFKAVQKVRSSLKDFNIYPVVFLREDIYNLIVDNDKTKWEDTRLQLEWTDEKLKAMLAYRISNEVGNEHYMYQDAMLQIFDPNAFIIKKVVSRYGRKKEIETPLFKIIMRNSQARPRDFISFFICCCQIAIEKNHPKVMKKDVTDAIVKYSARLAGELKDEIQNVLPEINIVYSLLSDIRKQFFTLQEFEECKNEYEELNKYKTRDLLKTLYDFSIIGNQDRVDKSKHYFRYQNAERRFSANVSFAIHTGIYKYLQIS